MPRVQWLDGLKGLAALIVAMNHFFKGEMKALERSYWDEPASENRQILQLPFLCLLWSSLSMVPLFMVLSGYSLSLSLFRLRDSGRTLDFLHRVQTGLWRRPVRLVLPLALVTALSQLVYFFNLYDDGWPLIPKGDLAGVKPWTDPLAHVSYALGYLADCMNIVSFQWRRGFNVQVWTIPLELRGSYAVYLVVMGLAGWRKNVRVMVLTAMMAYLVWYAHWDIFAFVSGVYLAEWTDTAPDSSSSTQARPPSDADGKVRSWRTRITAPATIPALLCGIHLLCLDGQVHQRLPPEYALLAPFRTRHWTRYNPYIDVQYMWQSIGAFLTVCAIANNPLLQRPFLSQPLQYLGQRHFGIYLVHELVFRMGTVSLRDVIWGAVAQKELGSSYPGSEIARLQDPSAFWSTWIGAGIVLGLAVGVLAGVCQRVLAWWFGVVDGWDRGLRRREKRSGKGE
ncbi:acyltransferase 3 [Aspergillus multicolor]|uniref:acyltransferase 3 n=1 Tax=Aspergillus multicolor TaxID=41759 RepID=UPI003CCE47FA